MKKFRFFLVSVAALALVFTGCQKAKEDPAPDNSKGKVTLSEVVDVAAASLKTWEDGEDFPTTFKVGKLDLSIAEYQFAICKALVNINEGKKDDIEVLTFKPAEHPERDSYDKETIAVANGPKNGDETEDLVNVATRMLARMDSELRVPNQTNFTRNGSAIAFSTDRATIVISRALAGYKADGKLATEISADYKGAAATLKAFATELVKYLDIWEKTVGTVDADGSHCTSNNTAWKDVHFIPIEYSGGYKDGEMYDEAKFPIWHPVVDGREYTAAECWSVAAQGIMDLVTKEGSSLLQPTRNPFVHTMGNGKSLSEPIPTPAEYATVTGFNAYPWYENTNDGKIINFSDATPCTVEFLCHELGWYLTRCTQFDTPAIGNFQQFGTGESTINYTSPVSGEKYDGIISAMRTFLIMIRFYDYLLKNNITENVWDAVKDVNLNYDLYGVEMPDIELKTKKLEFDCVESSRDASFTAKKAWTATASDSWITIEPASGDAGDITVKVTVAENKAETEREGKVIIKGGNVTEGLEIPVTQVKWTEPSTATIKDFAQEYVKVIDQWFSHVGNINRLSNWELAKDGDSDVVEDAHYVPNDFTIEVGGQTYTTGDMLEVALRSYLLLRGWNGNETEKAGLGNIPTADPVDINATVPAKHGFIFGSPLIETSNGGYFYKGTSADPKYGVTDPAQLDNWAQRSLNWPFSHDKTHTNFCGYASNQLAGYGGCFSSGRALITYAFFFKYMLENGLERADNLDANVEIRSELFGVETKSEKKATIKDFAEAYSKIVNIWENNIGTVNRLSNWELAKAGDSDVVENAHYLPNTTTIIVGDELYTTGDMLEVALRSYLLLRGWNGNETEKAGLGNIPTATPVAMSTTEVPAKHGFKFGSPLIETSNGGYFYKGTSADPKYGVTDPAQLDNWAQRSLNWPFSHDNTHTNFCGYASNQLAGYGGCFSSGRALITYAYFFKYMLENGLDKADALTSDVSIRSELFGVETAPAAPTLKDFAVEFVKGLDVWEKTVGRVDADGTRNRESKYGAWNYVHFIPIVGNTASDYYKYAGNQYDATLWTPWTLTVGKTEYSSSQAWEIAIKGLLNMCTEEGENFLPDMTDRNKAYTLKDAMALSEAPISETFADNKWGKHPWYEGGNLVTDGGKPVSNVDVNFLIKVGAWHIVRGLIKNSGNTSPLGMIGNYQEFGTGSSTLKLQGANGDYVGYISPMREMVVMMRLYKYLLDNNIDKNVYTAIKDQKFDFDLYGLSRKAEWEFTADAMSAYADNFGGTKGVKDKTAGDGGKYVASNKSKGGVLTYVQVDKTELDADSKVSRIVGGSGHPYVTGPWLGDYWLFTLNSDYVLKAGSKLHIKFITRTSATGPKYWVAEYWDGDAWQPVSELQKDGDLEYNILMNKDGKTNVTVEKTFELAKASASGLVRMRAVTTVQANDAATLEKPNGGTCRIAGAADGTSPVFEIVE